mgnify:CR=1 FL=1|jgi:hypothetical protein
MKKTYITPEIEVIRFEMEDILAASQIINPDEGSDDAPIAGGGFDFENGFKIF